MKVKFLAAAYDDIDRLHAFLFLVNADAADRMVNLLYEASLSLRHAPEKGRPLTAGLRELIVPFGKSAYVIRYRVYKQRQLIAIARIWHGKERR